MVPMSTRVRHLILTPSSARPPGRPRRGWMDNIQHTEGCGEQRECADVRGNQQRLLGEKQIARFTDRPPVYL